MDEIILFKGVQNCNTAKFGIELIPSEYRVSITDINTDTFYMVKQFIIFNKNNSQPLKLLFYFFQSERNHVL